MKYWHDEIKYLSPEEISKNYNDLLTKAAVTLEDPITKGTGLIYNVHFPTFSRDDSYTWRASFAIGQKDNPLFQKLVLTPIKIQTMPFIVEFVGDRTELVSVHQVRRAEVHKELDLLIFEDIKLEKLDNIKFMRAISRQRWLYNE
jgi:hypothetical protein